MLYANAILAHIHSLSLSPDAIYSALAICANLFTSSSLLTVIRSILVIKPLNHVNNISLSLAHTHNPLSVILSLVSSYLSHRPIIVFLIYRLSFNRTKHRVDNHRHETYQQQQNIYARRIQLSNEFIQQKYFLIKLNCNRVIREYHQIWSTFHKFVCYTFRPNKMFACNWNPFDISLLFEYLSACSYNNGKRECPLKLNWISIHERNPFFVFGFCQLNNEISLMSNEVFLCE